MAEESEQLSVGYMFNGSTCSLSFDQDGEQVVSVGGIEEPSVQVVSINDTEEAFSTHIIPIEEDDNDDDDDDDEDEVDEKKEADKAAGDSKVCVNAADLCCFSFKNNPQFTRFPLFQEPNESAEEKTNKTSKDEL